MVSVPGSGRKILVADDSNTVRRCAETFLWLGSQHVLLDLPEVVMPGQKGFQLSRAVARDPLNSDQSIIKRTRKYQGTPRFLGIRHGARDALTKPVKADALMSQCSALG